MAYGNYGAYVWKNGKNKTKEYCDVGYIAKDNKWQKYTDEDDDDYEKNHYIYSHAVIPITDDILVEFYKTTILINYIQSDGAILVEQLDTDKIFNNSKFKIKDLVFKGYELCDHIQIYTISHKGTHYCIVIGGGFGNGYDKNHVSKLIKKRLCFSEDDYYIAFKSGYELEYTIRKDDRKDIKYNLWNFTIKPMLRDINHFKFNLGFYLEDVKDYLQDFRYLL